MVCLPGLSLGRLCLVGAIGLLLIAWLEYRDTSLKTEDDIAATLALPLMAIVPVMPTRADRRRMLLRTLVLSSIAASLAIATGVLALKTAHLL